MPSPLFSSTGHARVIPTWLAVITVATLASIRSPSGFLVYTSNEVLAIVVPVAGTIVALALPAAQLAQSVLESFLSSAQGLIKSNRPIEGILRHLTSVAAERRRDLDAMKWVVLYGLISFLIGISGVFGAFSQSRIAEDLATQDLIACLSAAFLVASVLWFLPVVQSSFNFEKADKLVQLLQSAERAQSSPKPSPTAAPSPSPSLAPGQSSGPSTAA